MTQPEGSVIAGQEDLVCRLKKSLYGLKQAGRTWHQKIDVALQKLGFISLPSDHCLYHRRTKTSIIILALYVDDLLLAASSLDELKAFKVKLTAEFEMEDLGEASFFLGTQITRDRKARTITITQTAYLKALLVKHRMEGCHPTATPMDTAARHIKGEENYRADADTIHQYQSVIGGIMFAMLCTRPDIAHAVSILSKYAQNPTPLHVTGAQRVLRYLSGSLTRGITYTGTGDHRSEPELTGYSDSDWAQDRDDRKSISGYAFLLCGGAISWQAKKQVSPATSTVEAEYMAITAAAKETIWWRAQLQGLGYGTSSPTVIYSDSQGAITLAKNPTHHAGTKHIDLSYHFIRHQITSHIIALQYISTTIMTADVFTKALTRERHQTLIGMLGMHSI
jgi:hypothetical protein